MVKINSILLFAFLVSFVSNFSDKLENCNDDFYDDICGTRKQDNDWFAQANKNTQAHIRKYLIHKEWKREVVLNKHCDKLVNFITFRDGIYSALSLNKKSSNQISIRKIQRDDKKCTLEFVFKKHIQIQKAIKLSNEMQAVYEEKGKILKGYRHNDNELRTLIKKFFSENKVSEMNGISAFDKSRMFYHQCEGIKKEPKNKNKFDEIAKTLRSKSLAHMHRLSFTPLFILKGIDAVNKKNKRSLILLQSHFIGKHKEKDRKKHCGYERENIKFDGIHFNENDNISYQRFKFIAKLMNKKYSSPKEKKETLKKLVVFEKKIFMYSLGSELLNLKFEKYIASFTQQKLKEKFPNIFPNHKTSGKEFFEHIFAPVKEFEHEKVNVMCKSYFFALDKLISKTDKDLVQEYIEFSSFYSFYRRIYPFEDQKPLANNKELNCLILTEMAFSHVITKELFEKYKHIDMNKIEILIEDIKESFTEMIAKNKWIPDKTKENALKKMKNIKHLIGATTIDTNAKKVNMIYEKVKINKDFFISLLSAKQNNFLLDLKSVFNVKYLELVPHTLFNEANAAYDLRENKFTIFPGLLFFPFVNRKNDYLHLYSSLGFITGHELTHSIGQNSLVFSSDGTYNRIIDSKTSKSYERKLNYLKKISDQVCPPEELNNFDGTSEEQIADLGGFKIALEAYKKRALKEKIRVNESAFVDNVAKMFCSKKLSLEGLEKRSKGNRHPPNFCRVNLIAHTKDFAKIKQCRLEKDLLIEMW